MKHDQVDTIRAQWAVERPELDTSPVGVIGRISRASRRIDQLLQRNYGKFNVNGGEFDVLSSLRRSGPPYQLTPTKLFNSLMLSSGAMTNRLDRLERSGLIERAPDPSDRRGILVTLSQAGYDLIEEATVAHLENERQILQALNTEEQKHLADLLRKVLISFED